MEGRRSRVDDAGGGDGSVGPNEAEDVATAFLQLQLERLHSSPKWPRQGSDAWWMSQGWGKVEVQGTSVELVGYWPACDSGMVSPVSIVQDVLADS